MRNPNRRFTDSELEYLGLINYDAGRTIKRIFDLTGRGYEIVVGDDPNMHLTEKYEGKDVIRLYVTGHFSNPHHMRTIWAVK